MLKELEPAFVSDAGKIQNLYIGLRPSPLGPCGGVAVIESKAGSVRSNHWHRTDAHHLYVVSGQMEYYWRSHDFRGPAQHITVKAGEMVYTGARVEHTCVFPLDTVMISMSRFSRDAASHEADLVRCDDVRL